MDISASRRMACLDQICLPIWTQYELSRTFPVGGPSTNATAGIGLMPPPGAGRHRKNRTGKTGETGRLGVWYFRFLSEGKNVSTVPRIEASCTLASQRPCAADKARLFGPDRRSALRPPPPAGLRPDLEHVKAQYMSLSLPNLHMLIGSLPAGLIHLFFPNTRPSSQLLLRLWLSSVNKHMIALPPAPIRRSTARRETR